MELDFTYVTNDNYDRHTRNNRDYFTNKMKRPLLPCTSEVKASEVVSDKLKSLRTGQMLVFSDSRCTTCTGCSSTMGDGGHRIMHRKITLFTVAFGSPSIIVRDWTCSKCNTLNLFEGSRTGIYPVAKYSAFTTEILYQWVVMVCFRSISFREAYETTRYIGRSQELMSQRNTNLEQNDDRWNRRRANEAFRAFVLTIDVNSPEITRLLFSCPTCESQLTAEDKLILRIPTDKDVSNIRRFNSLVIDGTSAGIIGSLPNFHRNGVKLVAPKGRIPVRFLRRKDVHKAVKDMVNTLLRTLRLISRSWTGEDRYMYQIVREGLVVNLSARMDGRQGQKNRVTFFTNIQLELLRWYCNAEGCVCNNSSGEVHDSHCIEVGEEMRRSLHAEKIASILHTYFTVTTYGVVMNGKCGNEVGPAEVRGAHIRSFVETDWVVLVKADNILQVYEMYESILSMISVLLTEHCLLPYLLFSERRCVENDDNGKMLHFGEETMSGLIEESIGRSKQQSHFLRIYGECNHRTASSEIWPCTTCLTGMVKIRDETAEVNPVNYRLFKHLLEYRNMARPRMEVICTSLSFLMEAHCENAMWVSRRMDANFDRGSRDYWNTFAGLQIDDLHEEGRLSNFCFPGRSQVRPPITFDEAETQHCNKTYPRSKRYSAGLLTVQCACANPRLIGFVIMTKAESTALALSSIISHFPAPPRSIVYDNGCNLYSSTISRLPWILAVTRIIVDRFHYKSHRCPIIFDADSYEAYNETRTESAESINARIKKTGAYIRYLRSDNYMAFLQVRFALLNLAAYFHSVYRRVDMEDENLFMFFREIQSCHCKNCSADGPISSQHQCTEVLDMCDVSASAHPSSPAISEEVDAMSVQYESGCSMGGSSDGTSSESGCEEPGTCS